MNNTTKAVYDAAKRMIAGRIDVDEVVMMTGLPKEDVLKIKEEFDAVTGADMDFTPFNMGPILMDNYVTEEEQEDFNKIKEAVNQKLDPENM